MNFATAPRTGAALLGVFAMLALAGCAGGPSAVPTTSSAAPAVSSKFTQVGDSNILLAEFKNSAFPYRGPIPDPDDPNKSRPFLDVNSDGRFGHSSARNGVLWEDTTYNDRHVLLAASRDFDPSAPGVIVVYFHGNQATLSRDVIDRQQTPRQVARSGLNAVLVAPQLAYDALDSSAGNFWRPGGFAEFLDEAETKLASLYPRAPRGAFRRMPVVIVAYSGGYLPTAYSLAYGGAGERIHGVILLDALYGEPDKFASWIESEVGRTFFVSAYSGSSKAENLAMRERLERDGVRTVTGVPDRLGAGTVAFIDAGDVKHEDFVSFAWTGDPLTDVLLRMTR